MSSSELCAVNTYAKICMASLANNNIQKQVILKIFGLVPVPSNSVVVSLVTWIAEGAGDTTVWMEVAGDSITRMDVAGDFIDIGLVILG